MMRIHRARVNASLCAILAAAVALLLTAREPEWLMAVVMLGAAGIVGAITYGLTMTGLRAPIRKHGWWAAFAAVVSASIAFAGAWTAGEPALSVALAVLIVAAWAFLAALVVLGVGGAK